MAQNNWLYHNLLTTTDDPYSGKACSLKASTTFGGVRRDFPLRYAHQNIGYKHVDSGDKHHLLRGSVKLNRLSVLRGREDLGWRRDASEGAQLTKLPFMFTAADLIATPQSRQRIQPFFDIRTKDPESIKFFNFTDPSSPDLIQTTEDVWVYCISCHPEASAGSDATVIYDVSPMDLAQLIRAQMPQELGEIRVGPVLYMPKTQGLHDAVSPPNAFVKPEKFAPEMEYRITWKCLTDKATLAPFDVPGLPQKGYVRDLR